MQGKYCILGPSAARGHFAGSLLEHWLAAQYGWQKCTRKRFRTISGGSAGNAPRKLPGSYFGAFLEAAREMPPGGFQEAISDHFWTQRGKCLQEASRKRFRSISGGSAGNAPRRFPGSHFGAFLRQRGKCPQEASLPPLNRPRMLCLRVFGDHKAEKNAPPPERNH